MFVGEGLTTGGVYNIAGWRASNHRVPRRCGIYLESGDVIVNQIHYHFDHETPPDQSTIMLQTATSDEVAPTRRIGAPPTTPAEMPAPEEIAAGAPLCDRDAVLVELAGLYGGRLRTCPTPCRGCGGQLSDYDQLDGTVAHSSCDLAARNTGDLLGARPHAEFGASHRMTLHPDTPDERVLLDIPVWSLSGGATTPRSRRSVSSGATRSAPSVGGIEASSTSKPRYVTWNEGTVDEMCYSSVQSSQTRRPRRRPPPTERCHGEWRCRCAHDVAAARASDRALLAAASDDRHAFPKSRLSTSGMRSPWLHMTRSPSMSASARISSSRSFGRAP